jgi:hypothetical protein
MTIANAIKKLERNGWKVTRGETYYVATKPGVRDLIQFLPNGEDRPDNEIVCLRVRAPHDTDELQSDYFGGMFVDSMAQAFRMAERAQQV